MYTNELLEEKYKAQKQLSKKADKENKHYLEIIESEVRGLFLKNGWPLKFSKRKGEYLGQRRQNIRQG